MKCFTISNCTLTKIIFFLFTYNVLNLTWICSTPLEDTIEACNNLNTSHLCLSTLPNDFISIYRKGLTTILSTGMIVKFNSIESGVTEVTLVAGMTKKNSWIALAITDVSRGSMGEGGPLLLCVHDRGDVLVKMFFQGNDEHALVITPFEGNNKIKDHKISTKTTRDFFIDPEVTKSVIDGYTFLTCKFKITKLMWKLDFTELNLETKPYNIALAQGPINEDLHRFRNVDSLRPMVHGKDERYVSSAKYFLHKPWNQQLHINDYLNCGITDFCLGAGYDGCGSSSFDCKFFTKVTRKDNSTLSILLKSTTLKGFVGLGFSNTSYLHNSFTIQKWQNIQFIVVCDTGSQFPVIFRAKCNQTHEKDVTPCLPSQGQLPTIKPKFPTKKTEMTNSRDEITDVITCEFDIFFSGKELEMMQKKSIRFLMGGDRSGSKEWYNLLHVFPGDDNLIFVTNENTALLKEGETVLPPMDAWLVVKQRRNNLADPANLDPTEANCTQIQPLLILMMTLMMILLDSSL